MYVCSIYYYLTHTFDIGDDVLAQEKGGGFYIPAIPGRMVNKSASVLKVYPITFYS